MTRGRKPQVTRLVQRLDGSDVAKARLTALLEALAGKRTVLEAALRLGLSERRFHYLRNHCLQAALASLEPQPMGRPTGPLFLPERQQVAALERAVRELKMDLHAAQLREEIALAMPHLLQRAARRKKAAGTRIPR
jgi:hypothetical protein